MLFLLSLYEVLFSPIMRFKIILLEKIFTLAVSSPSNFTTTVLTECWNDSVFWPCFIYMYIYVQVLIDPPKPGYSAKSQMVSSFLVSRVWKPLLADLYFTVGNCFKMFCMSVFMTVTYELILLKYFKHLLCNIKLFKLKKHIKEL